MDDAMLNALRGAPSPEFAQQLWTRLQQAEEERGRRWTFGRGRGPLRMIAVPAGVLAAIVLLAMVPAVRAQAAAFLSLFRVQTFVPVRVDEARLKALNPVSIRSLLGEQVQEVQSPGPPTPVVSVEQAGALAGYTVRVPQWLPPESSIIEMAVTNEGLARVTADASRLNALLDTFGITDLRAPEGLDGQVATIRVPRGVMIRYQHKTRRTRFYQAPSPEVTMPSGVPLQALGEIGLRLLGVAADDARRFAAAIDWTSTLIVPIAPNVESVRETLVGGHPALAMEYVDGSPTNMVLWSTGDRVFAMVSIMGIADVLEMANSVR